MKNKLLLLSLLLILLSPIYTKIYGRGTLAGTRLTNTASVQYDSNFGITNSISTQVMAIYGMSALTGPTNGLTYPGGTVSFPYILTNNGNSPLKLIVTLSNFNTLSSNSVTNWKAYITGFTTIKTMKGMVLGYKSFTNLNILPDSTFNFTNNILTSAISAAFSSGFLSLVVSCTGAGNHLTYVGDNAVNYGGTNLYVLHPRVTIQFPLLYLRKTLSVSNQLAYLARGGTPGIPVPDSIITYTNFYVNNGNGRATNLIIIDTIPKDTDFITNSIVIHAHTNVGGIASPTAVSYTYNALTRPQNGPQGPFGEVPGISQIKIQFINGLSGNNGNPSGNPQDISAGYFYYKVVVNRRRN